MRVVAWDTETERFRPGVMAPELVCLSCESWENGARSGPGPRLVGYKGALPLLEGWLADPDTILVGHNVQYDVAVMCAEYPQLTRPFFDAYQADRITDTKWRQILLDIACGCYRWRTASDGKRVRVNYGLADLAMRLLGRNLRKEGGPRTTYGPLRGVPLNLWPEEHVKYAKDDAVNTLDAYLVQEEFRRATIEEHDLDFLGSEFREARAYLALHLASVWGLRTEVSKVAALEMETIRAIEIVQERLVPTGLVRSDGTRNLKAATAYMIGACEAKGIPVPRTKPTASAPEGNVCLDADACELADDAVLDDYASYVTLTALLNKDVKLLKAGTKFPVHTSFGIAESDRTTSSGPNVQNFKRAA